MLLSSWNSQYALQLQSMKNDMLSLYETINVFIDPFCNSKIHSHQLEPFNNVEILTCFVFIFSMELLSKGYSQERGYLAFNNRV